jgi:hypothetical protein
MNAYQEPKYLIGGDGKIYNRQSGTVIPDDEPIFILRARDSKAVRTLIAYNRIGIQGGDIKEHKKHAEAVEARIEQFTNWATAHPERMKNPDTTMDSGWSKQGKP